MKRVRLKNPTLTSREIQTVLLACHYAEQWEASYIDALTPDHGKKPDPEIKECIDRSRKLIQRMRKLSRRLEHRK